MESGYLHLNLANEWPSFDLDAPALEIGPQGELHLGPGAGAPFLERGVFRGGPFEVFESSTPWFRLRAAARRNQPNDHIRFFTATTEAGVVPVFDPTAEQPFPAPVWTALPRDVLDGLIGSPPARQLWIGGVLQGEGASSPELHQLRVEYGRDTYRRFLPAIYSETEAARDLLDRFLALHGSVLGGLEEAIENLPQLFDPGAAPHGEPPSWLRWLAGWLAFEVSEHWTEDEARAFLAEAFELHGRRGTLEGLRRYLEMYAGVQARIEEPIQTARVWQLGETSTLGFSTTLASAHLQGAVLASTATVDQSHLQNESGPRRGPLDDLAHRFCVKVYCGELDRPGQLEEVRTVLNREKPAHTQFHLCVIEPRMRVGVQAQVGIDTVVAGGAPAAATGRQLDTHALAAAQDPCITSPDPGPFEACPADGPGREPDDEVDEEEEDADV